jgi:transcriptional regulator with XRE-family HTH domain
MVSRFKLLLQNLNLTAAEFAGRIGVQRSSMSHILSGRNKPSVDFLEKTFNTIPEINAAWLITGKGNWNVEIGNSGPEEGLNLIKSSDVKTEMRLVAETIDKAGSLDSDRDITKPQADLYGGPVDHIIIVYKNNTFRMLDPAGKSF